ncbi:Serine/threonine-protein kinase plk2 [Mortierella sp. NVP41]|nr:Serine/threonine-protein kinase plk2 [Mortierella sp. NVP41]
MNKVIVYTDPKTGKTYPQGKLLGNGQYGTVYQTVCEGKLYAIKVLPRGDKSYLREKGAFKMLRYKHIIQMDAAFEDKNKNCLILEYCPNGCMRRLLKKRGKLTEPECRFFGRQVAKAGYQIHSKMIAHRDIKPPNILLDKDINAKIADFGFADYSFCDEHFGLAGSPRYASPEAAAARKHGNAADLYSFGCTLFRMMTGDVPLEDDVKYNKGMVHAKVESADISPAAKDLIKSLLKEDPEQRPSFRRILTHTFFVDGFCPESLDVSIFHKAPESDLHKEAKATKKESEAAVDALTSKKRRRPTNSKDTDSNEEKENHVPKKNK